MSRPCFADSSDGCDNHGRRKPVRDKVSAVIDQLRPIIRSDGGDVFLRRVDEHDGVVVIELAGGCGPCPSANTTLEAGIERIVKDRVDGVHEVRQPRPDDVFETPVQL